MSQNKVGLFPHIFLDIKINDEYIGKIIFELCVDEGIRISEHFLALCTGFSRLSPSDQNDPNYHPFLKGSFIKNVVNSAIEIGNQEITNLNYPGQKAIDTSLIYLACIKNVTIPNLYSYYILSSHFVTMKPNIPFYAFGCVNNGFGVIKQIKNLETSGNGKILKKCTISDCGIYDGTCKIYETVADKICDPYADCPEDQFARLKNGLPMSYNEVCSLVAIVNHIKYFGKFLYLKQDYELSLSKYAKALRYLNALLEFSGTLNAQENDHIMNLTLSCILNSAACRIKMKQYAEALNDCDEAMDLDPKNPRIYFRQAQSYHGLSLYNEALLALKKGLTLKPCDKAMMAEMIAINGEIAVYSSINTLQKSSNNTETNPIMYNPVSSEHSDQNDPNIIYSNYVNMSSNNLYCQQPITMYDNNYITPPIKLAVNSSSSSANSSKTISSDYLRTQSNEAMLYKQAFVQPIYNNNNSNPNNFITPTEKVQQSIDDNNNYRSDQQNYHFIN